MTGETEARRRMSPRSHDRAGWVGLGWSGSGQSSPVDSPIKKGGMENRGLGWAGGGGAQRDMQMVDIGERQLTYSRT